MSDEFEEDFEDDDDFDDEEDIGGDGNRVRGARSRDAVELIARNLVDDPDGVFVDANERGDNVTLLVHASPGDLGRIIGKRGRVIQAVRQLARVAAADEGVRISVDVAE